MKRNSWIAIFLVAGGLAGGLAWKLSRKGRTTSSSIPNPNDGVTRDADGHSPGSETPGVQRKMKEIREGDVTVLLPEKVEPGEAATVTIRYLPANLPADRQTVSLAGFAVIRNSENLEVGYIQIFDEKPKQTGTLVIEFPPETSRKAGSRGVIELRLGLSCESERESDAFSSLSFDLPIGSKE